MVGTRSLFSDIHKYNTTSHVKRFLIISTGPALELLPSPFLGCLASGMHSLGVRAHASGWPEKEITALRVVLDLAITRGLLVGPVC
jgi:hypothetical protein